MPNDKIKKIEKTVLKLNIKDVDNKEKKEKKEKDNPSPKTNDGGYTWVN